MLCRRYVDVASRTEVNVVHEGILGVSVVTPFGCHVLSQTAAENLVKRRRWIPLTPRTTVIEDGTKVFLLAPENTTVLAKLVLPSGKELIAYLISYQSFESVFGYLEQGTLRFTSDGVFLKGKGDITRPVTDIRVLPKRIAREEAIEKLL